MGARREGKCLNFSLMNVLRLGCDPCFGLSGSGAATGKGSKGGRGR